MLRRFVWPSTGFNILHKNSIHSIQNTIRYLVKRRIYAPKTHSNRARGITQFLVDKRKLFGSGSSSPWTMVHDRNVLQIAKKNDTQTATLGRRAVFYFGGRYQPKVKPYFHTSHSHTTQGLLFGTVLLLEDLVAAWYLRSPEAPFPGGRKMMWRTGEYTGVWLEGNVGRSWSGSPRDDRVTVRVAAPFWLSGGGPGSLVSGGPLLARRFSFRL